MSQVAVHVGATLRAHVETPGHQFFADEPLAKGGEDAGPNPYDLLLAALGTCTAITLRLYADRKQWPLERVHVVLSHARVHRDDCEDCEEDEGPYVDHIDLRLRLEGDLDPGQRARLREIADRCPVHRTLAGRPHVATTLE